MWARSDLKKIGRVLFSSSLTITFPLTVQVWKILRSFWSLLAAAKMSLAVLVRCLFMKTSFFVSRSCFRAPRTPERILLLANRISSGAYFALPDIESWRQVAMSDCWMSIWSSWQKFKKMTSDSVLDSKCDSSFFRFLIEVSSVALTSLLTSSENDNSRSWIVK